ncbi:hypothetical protein OAH18_02380 [bacterium]|nr:hypothetical protein [bacterium]
MSAYEAAVRYFEQSANVMELSQNMRKLLLTPEREVKVQVAMEMDNGDIGTFIGFRMQHNSARGPMKGGLRYHHEVDAQEVLALATTINSSSPSDAMAYRAVRKRPKLKLPTLEF